MEKWIKINSQVTGKDKIARLIQYLSRFIWYSIETRKNVHEIVTRLKKLEKVLSAFRKLLRFGKSGEALYGALNTIHLRDRFLKIVITMSRIYQGVFLLCDHFVWLIDAGLVKKLEKKKFSDYSNKFWLGSIILGLLRDAYEINSILYSDMFLHKKKSSFRFSESDSKTYWFIRSDILSLIREHEDVFWDTVKNLADICIPLSNLGHVKLSPGVVGFLGTVSSIAGLLPIINPQLKLVPS